jgi:PmbA protein
MREIRTLREALDARRRRGELAEWRITWTWVRRAEVGMKDSRAATVHSPLAMTEKLSVRLLVQWRDGTISRSRAGRAELCRPEDLLDRARASSYEDPDAANFSGPQHVREVPLFVRETAEAADGQLASFADLLGVARDRASAHTYENTSGSVSASHRRRGVLTSRGCSLEVESTSFGYGFWFEGLTGDRLRRREVISSVSAEDRLETACELVDRLKGSEETPQRGEQPVLLHPKVAESFLWTYVLDNLQGERVWNGRSAFTREQFRLNDTIAREDLTVRLEPLIPFGPGSYRFTAEGIPARPAAYLGEGRLRAPILDMKYARRFGREAVPPPSTTESIVLQSRAEAGPEVALRDVGRGLLVLGVLGLHTQDAASGDFSISAPQSLSIRARRIGGRVRAALTGHFLAALRSPDLRLVRFPGFHMPGVLLLATVDPS